MVIVYAPVAQGIEHRSPKAGVDGSNPPGGTRKIAGQELFLLLTCSGFGTKNRFRL